LLESYRKLRKGIDFRGGDRVYNIVNISEVKEMNKKRISIVVATLVVLVMAFALLAGCGVDVNFRKKIEKKGWEYEEETRGVGKFDEILESDARGMAAKFLGGKYVSKSINDSLKNVRLVASMTKIVGEGEKAKSYAVNKIEFDNPTAALTYYSALKKSLKEGREKNIYSIERDITEIEKKMVKAYGDERFDLQSQLGKKQKEYKEIKDSKNPKRIVAKKLGNVVTVGSAESIKELEKDSK